jgi:DNA polymerase epsilon subunit 2
MQLERKGVDTQFVVISDFHLDSPRVLSNFRSILNVYNESGNRPVLFILCGNFSSKPFLFDGRSTLSVTGEREIAPFFPPTASFF